LTVIVLVTAFATRVNCRFATTPEAIAVLFEPANRQVSVPVPAEQYIVFPAAVAAAPALAAIDWT
jgi:hypothetical protein